MTRTFIADETAAVTVDWVVLTAALVGLGLAALGVTSRGVEHQSGAIDGALRAEGIIRTSFATVLANATEGFVADATIAAGTTFTELRNVSAFSFQMDATLAAGDEGILFEAGGTGSGTILYQHDGVLYLQAGNGGAAGAAANRGEAVWTVADGTYSIEGSLDASGGLALYVDGALVSTSEFTNGSLAGGNHGTVGDGNTSVANNHGGFVQGDTHAGAGDLNIFVGDVTDDVPG